MKRRSRIYRNSLPSIRTKEVQKADIQKLIAEYQEKLEDKSNKLHAKEQELEQITKDAAKARSVIQPFRNHKVDFTPPQITEKVPLFGTDKWIERQNRSISKQFTEIVRKIESLYRNDAVTRQVEGAQRNVLADYGELYQLRRENKILSDTNENMESELNTLLGQLAIPSVRNMIFAVADALISGHRYQFLPEAVVVIPTQTFVGMDAGRMKRKRHINGGA